MKILAINTAFRNQITLLCDKKVSNLFLPFDKSTSETLLVEIDKLLKENDITLSQLDAIGVVVGPGSFTGIRIGVSTIKAIGYALKTKIIGINAFELFLHNCKCESGIIAVDSNVGDLYYAEVKKKKIGFIGVSDAQTLKKSNNNIYVNKEDVKIANFFKDKAKTFELTDVDLINCVKQKYTKGEIVELNELEPLYIKLSQAEREYKNSILSKLTINKGKIEDIDQILEIENSTFENDVFTKKMFEDCMNNPHELFIVAKVENAVVGYAEFMCIEGDCEIIKICVEKSHRRLGIAEKLFEYGIKKIKASILFLEVSDKNLAAIRLYQKLGFEKIDIRLKYYQNGDNAIVMRKQLKE